MSCRPRKRCACGASTRSNTQPLASFERFRPHRSLQRSVVFEFGVVSPSIRSWIAATKEFDPAGALRTVVFKFWWRLAPHQDVDGGNVKEIGHAGTLGSVVFGFSSPPPTRYGNVLDHAGVVSPSIRSWIWPRLAHETQAAFQGSCTGSSRSSRD